MFYFVIIICENAHAQQHPIHTIAGKRTLPYQLVEMKMKFLRENKMKVKVKTLQQKIRAVYYPLVMVSFFAIENKLPKNIMPNICMRIKRVLEYFVRYKKAFP